ncbi:MAG: SBBP repeat-containing protein, partial [candidate division WOR-3 bacterium]
ATIKYNPTNGDTLWVRTYNGPANNSDGANAIAVDGSGNVYVTGASWGGLNMDYATIKYNSLGVQQWVKRYDGPIKGADEAKAIAVDGSGNVYVTGYSYGSGSVEDYATIKYNSSGDSLWAVRYNGPGNGTDYGQAIAVDGSGNVYVTGYSYGGSTTGYDYATIKYNSSGVQQWVKRYNGPGNGTDYGQAMAIDGSGNVYVTGYSYGDSTTGYDYATIKYNSSGESLWAVRYNGPGNGRDYGQAIAVHQYGSVFVTGYSYGGSSTNYDYATIKYNSAGVEQWVKRYDGPGNGNDYARAIAVSDDPYANVYVTGHSTGSGTGYDYATIKYSRLGDSIWAERYDKNNTYENAVAIAYYSGAVYVTGYGESISGFYDYLTIKYTPKTGVKEEKEYVQTPSRENIVVYPTFTVANTKIHYSIPRDGRVLLEVFDASGRLIRILTDEHRKAGTYNAIWDGRDENGRKVAQGAYFFTLRVDNQAVLRKVLLLR